MRAAVKLAGYILDFVGTLVKVHIHLQMTGLFLFSHSILSFL
jgi:hypothetical protein